MAIKSYKIGTLQRKKDGTGNSIKLGAYNKNPQYATTVEIVVRDASGKLLATKTNGGYLSFKDPREREGITEEQLAKIPDFILRDVMLVVSDEE